MDRIFAEHPGRITWPKDVGCQPISWAFGKGIKSVSDLRRYLRAKRDTVHQIYQSVPCFYLAGIHPRNIPPDLRPVDIEDVLEPYLEDDLCLGIGEIGVETGRNQEKEIFSAQLRWTNK